eukprot:716829-Prymnesium_polylepis.1
MAQRGDPAHVTGSCLIWLDTYTRARSRERLCEIRVLGDSGLGGRVTLGCVPPSPCNGKQAG